MDLRVNGVYNQQTFQFLSELGVKKFTFDFRPVSMNFIQEYVVHDILKELSSANHQYYLMFQNEKDFVVSKITNELINNNLLRDSDSLFLDFRSNHELSYFEQFKTPFYWSFDESVNYYQIIDSPLLKGLTFSSTYLERLNERGQLFKFLSDLQGILQKSERDLKLHLEIEWETSIQESIFDFLILIQSFYLFRQKLKVVIVILILEFLMVIYVRCKKWLVT
jgi:hypothetical protein